MGHPIQSRVRKLSPDKLEVVKKEINKLANLGILKKGKSKYSLSFQNPVVVTVFVAITATSPP